MFRFWNEDTIPIATERNIQSSNIPVGVVLIPYYPYDEENSSNIWIQDGIRIEITELVNRKERRRRGLFGLDLSYVTIILLNIIYTILFVCCMAAIWIIISIILFYK
tara:strand:- start:849 stop:1169 length:321 start_codon:yes stop_codon:yes gene_type:complete